MKDIIKIQSINEVHAFYGFEPPKHPLVTVIPIDKRITEYDYGDTHYIFDFYQISMKLGVSGSMIYGRNSYDFREGVMTFIKPNQIIKVEKDTVTEESSGWALLFHPDLIRKSHLGQTIEEYSFFKYEVHEALHLSEDEKLALTGLVKRIEEEYQNIDKYSQELIIGNIEMLLRYCKRYYDRQFYTRTNLNKDLFSKFEDYIQHYYNSNKPFELGILSVKECASALNMSANYLGDLIKSETGITAKEHIQGYIIERAKTKMMASNESISQIAYSLGFEYPQGFSKLFKAKTGMSPSQYRHAH